MFEKTNIASTSSRVGIPTQELWYRFGDIVFLNFILSLFLHLLFKTKLDIFCFMAQKNYHEKEYRPENEHQCYLLNIIESGDE